MCMNILRAIFIRQIELQFDAATTTTTGLKRNENVRSKLLSLPLLLFKLPLEEKVGAGCH